MFFLFANFFLLMAGRSMGIIPLTRRLDGVVTDHEELVKFL